jgi:Fur family transcriptional regulator, ferric uptake regulator
MILILMEPLLYTVMPPERGTDRERLATRLRAAGIRPTPGRVRILRELAREPDDATAQVLHARLRKRGERVGLATVYRALHDFAAAGLVDNLPHSAGESCYRLCSEGHHHHLVCSKCHHVVELTDCRLEPWLRRAAAEQGFEATEHRLEVVGLCGDCRA